LNLDSNFVAAFSPGLKISSVRIVGELAINLTCESSGPRPLSGTVRASRKSCAPQSYLALHTNICSPNNRKLYDLNSVYLRLSDTGFKVTTVEELRFH
jgi:hypothetical protein